MQSLLKVYSDELNYLNRSIKRLTLKSNDSNDCSAATLSDSENVWLLFELYRERRIVLRQLYQLINEWKEVDSE